MSHFQQFENTFLGDIEVEWDFEERGSPSNGWDDPGSGPIIYIDSITNIEGTLKWFMPKQDYSAIENLCYDSGIPDEIDQEGPGFDYDY